MRVRLVLSALALSLCGLVLLAASQARAAICTPTPGGTVCLGSGCTQLGATTMDSNQKNLIACLKDDSTPPQQVWKSMSGGGDGPPGMLCGLYLTSEASPSGVPAGIPCKGTYILDTFSPVGAGLGSLNCPSGYALVSLGSSVTSVSFDGGPVDPFTHNGVTTSTTYSCRKI